MQHSQCDPLWLQCPTSPWHSPGLSRWAGLTTECDCAETACGHSVSWVIIATCTQAWKMQAWNQSWYKHTHHSIVWKSYTMHWHHTIPRSRVTSVCILVTLVEWCSMRVWAHPLLPPIPRVMTHIMTGSQCMHTRLLVSWVSSSYKWGRLVLEVSWESLWGALSLRTRGRSPGVESAAMVAVTTRVCGGRSVAIDVPPCAWDKMTVRVDKCDDC